MFVEARADSRIVSLLSRARQSTKRILSAVADRHDCAIIAIMITEKKTLASSLRFLPTDIQIDIIT